MPYIEKQDRSFYTEPIKQTISKLLKIEKEEDRYDTIRTIIINVIKNSYPENLRYFQHNEIVGMLECCRLEWYRRRKLESYTSTTNFPLVPIKSFFGPKELISKYIKNSNQESKAGNLNYFITALLTSYYNSTEQKTRYLEEELCSLVADIKEFWYEKETAPYEDEKIEENGDVS